MRRPSGAGNVIFFDLGGYVDVTLSHCLHDMTMIFHDLAAPDSPVSSLARPCFAPFAST